MAALGSIDAPSSGAVVRGRVRVAGWVVCPGGAGVVVLVDGQAAVVATTGLDRPDVAAAVPEAGGDGRCGWQAEVDLDGRRPGPVTVTAVAIQPDGTATPIGGAVEATVGADGEGWPPERCGTLDQPADGALLDDLGLRVHGWAPPLDGGLARVEVLVGGQVVGLARPLHPRPDVAAVVHHPYARVCGFDFLLERGHVPAGASAVAVRAVGWHGTALTLGPVQVRRADPPVEVAPSAAVVTAARRVGALADRLRRAPDGRRTVLVGHNLAIGGAQRWFGELALGLHGRGADVVALAGRGGSWAPRLEEAGVPVHLLAPVPITDGERYEHRIGELCAVLAAVDPAVVLVNTRSMFPAVDAAHRLGLPVVWAIHESTTLAELWSSVPRQDLDLHVVGRLAAALQAADRVVCATDHTARVHGLEAGGRAVTVPYGVDLEAVDRHRSEVDRAEARRRLGVEADAQLVVWPASFSHRKAQLALVEVARRLRTAHPSLVVAMVGRTDDPAATDYGEAVDLYVAAQGLGATARSVPAVVDPWDWLVAADLLVCPSDAESSPYAILEAMAYEVPVVATAVAGIPDVVVPGRTGWLVEPRDLRALADTTSAALSDRPALRARAVAARRLVEQRHAHRPWLDAVASLLRP